MIASYQGFRPAEADTPPSSYCHVHQIPRPRKGTELWRIKQSQTMGRRRIISCAAPFHYRGALVRRGNYRIHDARHRGRAGEGAGRLAISSPRNQLEASTRILLGAGVRA